MVGKLTAPNAAVFDPDALEQIYAKGLMDPSVSGYMGTLGMLARKNRRADGAEYLRSLGDTNKLQAALEQAALEQKHLADMSKLSVEAAEKLGLPIDALIGMGQITLPNAEALGKVKANANLSGDLLRSKIHKNMSGGEGGGGSGEKTVITTDPLGINTSVRTEVKGRAIDEATVERNAAIARRLGKDGRNEMIGEAAKRAEAQKKNREQR